MWHKHADESYTIFRTSWVVLEGSYCIIIHSCGTCKQMSHILYLEPAGLFQKVLITSSYTSIASSCLATVLYIQTLERDCQCMKIDVQICAKDTWCLDINLCEITVILICYSKGFPQPVVLRFVRNFTGPADIHSRRI